MEDKLVLLFSGYRSGDVIQLRDRKGKMAGTIEFLSDKYGQQFKLRKPRRLRVRDDNKLVVCEQKAVQCFNLFGVL